MVCDHISVEFFFFRMFLRIVFSNISQISMCYFVGQTKDNNCPIAVFCQLQNLNETEGGVHMKMSDVIADFIGEMLSSGGGVAEVQRKSLADRFSCVPSQINYVIETRFTPEHGYLVESQRGGGGYIRIVRLMDDKQRTLLEAARGIGGRLTQNDAARLTRALLSAELLTQREAQLLLSACSDGALAEVDKTDRDRLRAAIFRCAVMGIATA